MKKSSKLVAISGGAAGAALGAMLLFGQPGQVAADNDPGETIAATGPLDGKTFTGMLGPDGKPKDVKDVFVFENGTFVSRECELRCEYPARPYFVRNEAGAMHFISETKCPYKDAKITWRGTVKANTISGTATWRVKRWYWTVESTYAFEGRLSAGDTPLADAR